MFEKEAEEYTSNVFNPVQEKFFITRGLVQGHIAVAFKDGAEFGYNKAKEWHYVADGDLPKECTDVLAIDILAGKPSEPSLYHFVTSDTWEWLPKRIACLSNEQMLAWCEIPTFTE